MKLRQILFSFKGRIKRQTYWLCLIVPFGSLVIIGMLIGGILAAQSMINTTKVQTFCREAIASGAYSGDCKQVYVMANEYNIVKAENPAVELSQEEYCLHKQQAGQFEGDCAKAAALMSHPDMANLLLPVNTSNNQSVHSTSEPISPAAAIGSIVGVAVLALLWIPLTWIGFAVTAKRLHDRNISGWWQLAPTGISILSLIGGFIGSILGFVSVICGLILFIICGFLKGTPGPNRFGPDPLDKKINSNLSQ